MRDTLREKEYREEAEQLAQLPRADQRKIIALHRSVADDAKVSKANRQEAKERAAALERFLRLRDKKKPKKA